MIPLEECVPGGIYKVEARNFSIAAYQGEGKFIGIRHKFGQEFLDVEHHWDDRSGTVKPLTRIGTVDAATGNVERENRLLFDVLKRLEKEDEQ